MMALAWRGRVNPLHPPPMTHTSLDTRTGLPDALRALLADYPRTDWTLHRNFDGLVSFWLDRHLNFRALTATMAAQTAAILDQSADPQHFAATLSHLGNRFLSELHGHHQIEDSYFFPRLTQLEHRLAHGFDMLETDHLAIDGLLHRFTTSANAVLTTWQTPALLTHAAAFAADLHTITTLLDRHLTDEEDLIVPVILHHGPHMVE
jgi:iron-sulfur cluster repair protein YtfE (RIC family)